MSTSYPSLEEQLKIKLKELDEKDKKKKTPQEEFQDKSLTEKAVTMVQGVTGDGGDKKALSGVVNLIGDQVVKPVVETGKILYNELPEQQQGLLSGAAKNVTDAFTRLDEGEIPLLGKIHPMGSSMAEIDETAMLWGGNLAERLNVDRRVGEMAGLYFNPLDPLGLVFDAPKLLQKASQFDFRPAAKGVLASTAQPVYALSKDSPDYIKWRTAGEAEVATKVAAGQTENLGKGLAHYVDKSTGTRYRLGTRYKDGKVYYTNVDLDKRGIRDLKRATSIELDNQTLLNLFKGNQKTVDSYKAVNKKVINKIQAALTEHNKLNKLTGNKKLTLEHVFDVQHYGRLGEALPPFSGKGADELFNLTILQKGPNIKSGAKARYMDSGEALIKAIQNGTFIDYHKTTSDFIKLDLAKKVESMSTADWKRFTDLAIANPSTNAHTLLVNFK